MSRRSDLQKMIRENQRHVQILKEQAAGYGKLNVPSHILTQIEDYEAEIDELQAELDALDKQLSRFNIPGVETRFHQDLNSLIHHTNNDFEEVKGRKDFVHSESGSICYKSKFSFEYSTSNDIWYRPNGTYDFGCRFYKGNDEQEADAIFVEYAGQIKRVLSEEWQFQQQDTPNRLYRKTLNGVRKYNSMNLKLELAVWKSNKCEVTFSIEKEQ